MEPANETPKQQPDLQLGKATAQFDRRSLKFASLLKSAMLLPDTYDFDAAHPDVLIPTPMFANDVHGDCVIAGRAHQTIRFELLEQDRIIEITDGDVTNEYFRETGGNNIDHGLVVLDSLKEWRSSGWQVGDDSYSISAFAEINYANSEEFKQAVYSDVGLGLGLQLPLSAKQQFFNKQPWQVSQGPDTAVGSWGGHYVHICGYTPEGPVCVTWGRKQPMTWDWMAKYADEAYAIFDANNNFKKNIVDTLKLQAFIETLQ
ncbi:hypothetical protein [Hymenobacter baengnokdamensis]|uniref:hypothetical protein n=1 Tax=Hymenobacter baengnokdamensis TaxID=2615203 RepID=UPI0012452080|nr:hypothetical protein [Hymenobacter baengnokdamensis]